MGLTKVIPADYYHSISNVSLKIISLSIRFSSIQLNEVISCVKHKLVEIIMELEKKFDYLDKLDIKSQVEADPTKKELVTNNIVNIIYDESITIGNGNKISKSELGHSFEGEETVEHKNRR